ncbi:unnamed protein product [Ostreobium quekettii]|uniref:TraB family protein n=1 Tax=Ostreobium quekettii TaxID=121088 RepID=A0A8S1IV46_9CHLO|nr:unnamed protein product [Ostreobium quekettii]|eukprot:evm.model.scf_859EXC.7 EVM.evm.TU.scf_859EXC.7   scf_859EXC:43597-45500(+)
MDPGLEFKVAMEEGEKRGARIVFGDVPIKTTMGRITSAMTAMDVVKIFASPLFSKPSPEMRELFENMKNIESVVEGMKRRVVVRAMQRWMAEMHPKLAQVLIHERDKYMVEQLRKLEGRVVAVVGLGHLDGIERLWEDTEFGASQPPTPSDHSV